MCLGNRVNVGVECEAAVTAMARFRCTEYRECDVLLCEKGFL